MVLIELDALDAQSRAVVGRLVSCILNAIFAQFWLVSYCLTLGSGGWSILVEGRSPPAFSAPLGGCFLRAPRGCSARSSTARISEQEAQLARNAGKQQTTGGIAGRYVPQVSRTSQVSWTSQRLRIFEIPAPVSAVKASPELREGPRHSGRCRLAR